MEIPKPHRQDVLSQAEKEEQLKYDTFYEHAALIQTYLDNYDEMVSMNPDTDEHIQSAVSYLNELCPYMDQIVAYDGYGYFPDSSDGFSIKEGRLINRIGIYRGIKYIQYDDGDGDVVRQIVQLLYAGTSTDFLNSLASQETTCYELADFTTSIIPVQSVNSIYQNLATESIVDSNTIIQSISTIYKHTQDLFASEHFRALPATEQVAFMSDMITRSNINLQVRDRCVTVEVPYCYSPLISNNTVEAACVTTGDATMSGICLGIEPIKTILPASDVQVPFDPTAEFGTPCLVIEPDDDTANGLNLQDGQILYLPLALSLKKMEFYADPELE